MSGTGYKFSCDDCHQAFSHIFILKQHKAITCKTRNINVASIKTQVDIVKTEVDSIKTEVDSIKTERSSCAVDLPHGPPTGSAHVGSTSQWSAPVMTGNGTSQLGTPVMPGEGTNQWGAPVMPVQGISQWDAPVMPGQTTSQRGAPVMPGQGTSQQGTPVMPGQGTSQRGASVMPGQGTSQWGTPVMPGQGTSQRATPAMPGQGTCQQGTTVMPGQGTTVMPGQGTIQRGAPFMPGQGTSQRSTPVMPGQGTSQQSTPVMPGQGTSQHGTTVMPGQGTIQRGAPVMSGQGTSQQGTTVMPGQGTSQRGAPVMSGQGTSQRSTPVMPGQGTTQQGASVILEQSTNQLAAAVMAVHTPSQWITPVMPRQTTSQWSTICVMPTNVTQMPEHQGVTHPQVEMLWCMPKPRVGVGHSKLPPDPSHINTLHFGSAQLYSNRNVSSTPHEDLKGLFEDAVETKKPPLTKQQFERLYKNKQEPQPVPVLVPENDEMLRNLVMQVSKLTQEVLSLKACNTALSQQIIPSLYTKPNQPSHLPVNAVPNMSSTVSPGLVQAVSHVVQTSRTPTPTGSVTGMFIHPPQSVVPKIFIKGQHLSSYYGESINSLSGQAVPLVPEHHTASSVPVNHTVLPTPESRILSIRNHNVLLCPKYLAIQHSACSPAISPLSQVLEGQASGAAWKSNKAQDELVQCPFRPTSEIFVDLTDEGEPVPPPDKPQDTTDECLTSSAEATHIWRQGGGQDHTSCSLHDEAGVNVSTRSLSSQSPSSQCSLHNRPSEHFSGSEQVSSHLTSHKQQIPSIPSAVYVNSKDDPSPSSLDGKAGKASKDDGSSDDARLRKRGKVTCKLCGGCFLYSTIKMHMNAVHGNFSAGFTCNTCNETFSDRGKLMRHKHSIHIKRKTSELQLLKLYTCNICDKSFAVRGIFLHHKRNHTVKETSEKCKFYQCNICKKSFVWEGKLLHHKLIFHASNSDCDSCGRRFSMPRRLQHHKKNCEVGLDSSQARCYLCGIVICQKQNLARHMRQKHGYKYKKQNHGRKPGQKGYLRCDLCSKTFRQQQQLEGHKRTTHPKMLKQTHHIDGKTLSIPHISANIVVVCCKQRVP